MTKLYTLFLGSTRSLWPKAYVATPRIHTQRGEGGWLALAVQKTVSMSSSSWTGQPSRRHLYINAFSVNRHSLTRRNDVLNATS